MSKPSKGGKRRARNRKQERIARKMKGKQQ